MANPEHLKILKRGGKAWNKWRTEHPELRPDLNNAVIQANLIGADLSNTDLQQAVFSACFLGNVNLTGAHLYQASFLGECLRDVSFRGAYLNGTNFQSAELDNADFRKASLMWVNFTSADLSGADLSYSDLTYSTFHYTRLDGTNFNYSILGGGVFISVDLSAAKGLKTIRHRGPSPIDVGTFYRSQGDIPEVFLRGVGVTEEFILYVRSLLAAGQPIQFYSCFISYSSKDQDFADRLHADLQSKGVRCWFAPEDLKIGDRFRDRIDESIRLHDKLLIILSENSVSSPWVSDEVESAIEREHREGRTVLFPIKIDEAVTGSDKAWAASIRRTRHIGDFTRWKEHDSYSKAFDRLLRDLKAEEERP